MLSTDSGKQQNTTQRSTVKYHTPLVGAMFINCRYPRHCFQTFLTSSAVAQKSIWAIWRACTIMCVLSLLLCSTLPGDIFSADFACKAALDDTQDHIDTVDQAGLYALLGLVNNNNNTTSIGVTADPMRVYNHPCFYRGSLLSYDCIFDNHVYDLPLSRPGSGFDTLYYVVAQIPFGENIRMPAIILLPSLPKGQIVDRGTVTGYFYMIYRGLTQQGKAEKAAAKLDFLVFVADELTVNSEAVTNSEVIAVAGRSATSRHKYLAVGAAILLVVWLILRRRCAALHSQNRCSDQNG